jgi:uncharacterized protein (TIGR03435 family)
MFAQTPAARPAFDEFEVATIKPTDPDFRGRFIRMESTHQFVAKNHALNTLIAAAYNLNPRAISGGPAWVESDHYDILAKAPGEVRPSLDEQMAMLRKLLADRFKLTFHREQKEMSIYALTVAKNGSNVTGSKVTGSKVTGSKLKESAVSPDESPVGPPPLIFVVTPPAVRLAGRYATMAELASVFQRSTLDRPVVDKTGLAGRYDFDLEFTPDESQFSGMLGRPPSDAPLPGLFAAIQQQLGLKLEATKGPVDVLVVDRAERPSEN